MCKIFTHIAGNMPKFDISGGKAAGNIKFWLLYPPSLGKGAEGLRPKGAAEGLIAAPALLAKQAREQRLDKGGWGISF
jgi:hypothetical protein